MNSTDTHKITLLDVINGSSINFEKKTLQKKHKVLYMLNEDEQTVNQMLKTGFFMLYPFLKAHLSKVPIQVA